MNWQSTKFLHAIGVQAVASVALFTGHLDGATWVAASTIALGIYSIADVAAKKVEQGNG
jgi:type IV secretory pathway protease TraF